MADHHQLAVNAARDGRWDEAHRIAQDHEDALSYRIHGYLHWVEGDISNARYWYERAGAPFPDDDEDAELVRLVGLAGEG